MNSLAFMLLDHASPPTTLIESTRFVESAAQLITFFSPLVPFVCSYSSRCTGDTNTKWNLIPPLCIFARANPAFSLRFPLADVSSQLSDHIRLPLPIDEILFALYYPRFRNFASIQSSCLVFKNLRKSENSKQ